MRDALENVYATALSNTFKIVAPIKRNIIKTDCEVHIFIQENALNILKVNGYQLEYEFFEMYMPQINKGLVWADQDFKCYHHFYNPKLQKGKFGYDDNALTVAKSYYDRSIKYLSIGNYERAMFYFGAACHIVQDLTIPQHAKGKLLDNHRQFEVYVKSNYKKMKRFKTEDKPILLNSIDSYIEYNANLGLNLDYMYRNITDLTTKFYLTAIKAITVSQRTTAGCMLMLYDELHFS
ncbi:phospholipase [Romboutsia ilealis]|uniref:Phospholipase C n=1 Tax=Romboutsia faecis TaxID=2764597 RepID=A0ABR7JRK1_9FIRM|nr:zinc dependent phospholipase C family protein [Romboutsia faecis]MBC5997534.1 zinc dependent phospholipase C family protein [Romboutsia faecis]MRN24833.1 phospholipase [Romboutsia ilealis]